MKSDGVATATMEPEAGIGVEPVIEAAPPGEEQQQQQPPPQPENKSATEETTPPAEEEVNDKVPVAHVKPKTKGAPVKGKPGAAAGKPTGTTGTSNKTGTAQQRTSNGDRKTVANGLAKKTAVAAAGVEKKTVAPAKRPVGAATSKAAERKPAAARPATAPASSSAAANGVKQPPTKKVATPTGTTAGAKVRPSTAGPKPSTTVQPSRATPAAKTEKVAAPKTARPAASSRPAASAAPRPAPARAGVSAPSSSKPAASQPSKTTTQPSRTTTLPSKTVSAPAKKDVTRPSTTASKRPTTTAAPAKTAAVKPIRTEPAKVTPAAAPVVNKNADPKRLPSTPKATEKVKLKLDSKTQSPLKSAGSPRNPTKAGMMKTASPSPKKPIGSSAPVPVRRLGTKPTQSVQPIMTSAESKKGSKATPASAVVAVAADPATEPTKMPHLDLKEEVVVPQSAVESHVSPTEDATVPSVQAVLPSPGATAKQAVVAEGASSEMHDVPAVELETTNDVPFAGEKGNAATLLSLSETVVPEPSVEETALACSESQEKALADEPVVESLFPEEPKEVQVMPEQYWEHQEFKLETPLCESALLEKKEQPETEEEEEEEEEMPPSWGAERKAVVPTDNMGAQKDKGEIEKADAEINEDDEIRSEEDFSHSSVSEMGESQATEEGSKTVAEQTEYMERSEPSGIDMHQGLTSEMDSEDVSQPCMSELSAPQSDAGLLEGMESMDDLREVGRGASPDIEVALDVQQDYFLQERGAAHPVNASEDRDYDMDVGSEKVDPESTENVEHEDDEDVEMVSEVVTESGLESYGNPDEDDLVEEMSRDVDLKTPDNLNFLSATTAVDFEVPEHTAQAVQPPAETEVPENNLSANNPFVSFTPEADASPVREETAGFQLNSAENIMDSYNTDLQEDTTFSAPNMEAEPQSVETVLSEKGASDSACMGVEFNSSPDELPTPVCETPTEQELLYSMAAKPQSLPVESLAELCKQAEPHNPPKTEKEAAPGSPQEEADKLPFESPASPPEREPEKGLSKSSTLSGPELAAQSSSETSTPEELKDYNSSSGVESKSEEKLGGIQLHHQIISPLEDLPLDQDLGIHLEKGDEETETLPADDILGDPPTESVASSEEVTEEDHSDTEGEILINDPGVVGFIGIDNIAFEETGKKLTEEEAVVVPDCKLPTELQSVEEYEEQHMMSTDAGGPDTPHSTNSVASYAFDCTSNAHSMTESCSKSPGIFSLENEDQLLEESKDNTLMKELNLQQVEEQTQRAVPTAPDSKGMDSYQNNKDRNVDLLTLEDTSPCETAPQLPKSGNKGDCEYMFCVTSPFPTLLGNLDTDCSSANPGMPNMISDLPSEESDRDSPDHALNSPAASPSDGDHAPPYYSAICETTDSMLTGNV
ncbi:titin homolog [Polyodon spathula]|uniref:titin homolog n=1 Tax=Polyodon spathula TaxID=7913 RepID=UPI001B7E4FE6|nr:titin homolog [Polyodon spathula]